MGVVGVSPRYAERAAHKFSHFWRLPQRAIRVPAQCQQTSYWP